MAKTTPGQLILRCYGYNNGNQWVGICVDLDIAIQANTETELKKKMETAVRSYIEVVLNTSDRESIPALLRRKAPALSILKFHLIGTLMAFSSLRRKFFTFDEALPFHLASSC